MIDALVCERCGAPLPAHAAQAVVTCTFCGTSGRPAPKVVERVVDRVVVVEAAGDTGTTPACPRCAERTRRVEVRDTVVFTCASCGGTLLSTDQVTRLTQASDEELVRAARRAAPILAPIARRRAALSCPACAKALRTSEIEGTVYLMHTCDAHGTFFETGALEAFMTMWRERRAGEISDEDLAALGIKR